MAAARKRKTGDPVALADFVERFAGALAAGGFPAQPARVFVALMVHETGRMTAADLADRLQISPAAVSGAVRYLLPLHLIRREREPGSRRHVYVVAEDAWHDTMLSQMSTYQGLVKSLDSGLAAVPAGSPAERRLQVSREFLLYVMAEMQQVAHGWDDRRRELRLEG